ncbi:MAG: hypothetical protein GTO63_33345, partial [Anaerolineae bacterium]|nr:hypothetical protein [Anaerolineae bacterium]NIN99538.1 hypothetical protein [Anaerolineae bacterium]
MLTARHYLVRISLLLVLFCLGCERPSSEVQATNKELLREVYAAIDRQDFDRLGELISEDAVLHFTGIPEPLGRDATFDLMREFYAAFPDYTHVIEEMIAEGNRVAVRLTFDATHLGEFEGIAPTGKRVSYAGMHIGTIKDGVIEEWWVLRSSPGFVDTLKGVGNSPLEGVND